MVVVAVLLICVHLVLGSPLEDYYDDDIRPLCPCGRDGRSLHTRVVGGQTVPRYSFPYATGLVLKGYGTEPFCGGTLITDRHIVTAAHCLKYKTADELLVDVGDYDIHDKKDGKLIPVQKITSYPEYKPGSFHTDIAIVELKQPVLFKKEIQTIPLPNPEIELKPGTTVIVFGWGRLNYTGGHPDKLHAVKLPVVDNDECRPKFISKIEETMICAGGEEGRDACIGDSGSGLVEQLDNQNVLVGVVSFGRRCALPHVPGVYTRVSSFLDWIVDNTQLAGCKPCIYDEKYR